MITFGRSSILLQNGLLRSPIKEVSLHCVFSTKKNTQSESLVSILQNLSSLRKNKLFQLKNTFKSLFCSPVQNNQKVGALWITSWTVGFVQY